MNVDIEFFDVEPIENLVTSLNFKMDKVIYFGYVEDMTMDKRHITEKNLKEICGISNVDFIEMSKDRLDRIVEVLENVIETEKSQGNQCFIDVTGGGELELVAIGMLSARHELPLHRFDLQTGELQTLNENGGRRIDILVEKRKIEINLDDVMEIHGGAIDYNEETLPLEIYENEEFKADTKKMWKIAKNEPKVWNGISAVFKNLNGYEVTETKVSTWKSKLESMAKNTVDVGSADVFYKYFNSLNQIGIIKNIKKEQGKFEFEYKNRAIKECIIDAGTLLELNTYYKMKDSGKYSDCRRSVHINWDAEVGAVDDGVENEIDVMALEGYVPVIVSCKNGRVKKNALYELETVANRFGGKYARKTLVSSQGLTPGDAKRAFEMGIEVTKEV